MFQLSLATPASEVGNRYDEAQLLPLITGSILNGEEIPGFPSSMGGLGQQYDIFFRFMAESLGFNGVEMRFWVSDFQGVFVNGKGAS